MPPGRPPNTQPALAYDYRRYIVLVQAIANGKWTVMHALMKAWEVPLDRVWCDRDGKPTFEGMCHMLSKFVIEHHTQEAPDHATD